MDKLDLQLKSFKKALSDYFGSRYSENDISKEYCNCKNDDKCICDIFSEVAREAARQFPDDDTWKNWRTAMPKCGKPTCKGNQVFDLCDKPYQPTCSHPNPSNSNTDSCASVCKCDKDLVLNDIDNGQQCIKKEHCPCKYRGVVHQPGAKRTSQCETCTCTNGIWDCTDTECSGTCKIENGYHITTFDGSQYELHGDCNYLAVLSEGWSLVTTIRQCQVGEKQTCLQHVTLFMDTSESGEIYSFTNDGGILYNDIPVTDDINSEAVTIFRPTQGIIHVDVNEDNFNLKMQIQTSSVMQLYLTLPETAKNKTRGLCGTYDDKASNDFLSIQNSLETANNFADSWKLDKDCNIPDDMPCVDLNNAMYAEEKCAALLHANGRFASCHNAVPYQSYYEAGWDLVRQQLQDDSPCDPDGCVKCYNNVLWVFLNHPAASRVVGLLCTI
ncbi:mucin-19-like [Protopterus annectens]|uniref:mucin-19-like n=1 Tax=Protopterus annectens TaxID=7888 RepID=UPI001CFA4765|nr:mucin-19-like [Protopterus annectens]